ncbi:MAG: family 78 glycoside hydrolase catalytic domain, partial [Terrimicrobiaceae bacterium]
MNHPIDLRADYQKNPLALDSNPPRLSWVLTSSERGFVQTAYQILAATSHQQLDQDKGDLWDSGKVSGSATSAEYGGKPLGSFAECFWKVRVWDAQGADSPWSEPARWGAGVLNPSDWKAEWIDFKTDYNASEAPSPWFRKTFELTSEPARAIAYVGSAGYHELYVNGRKVGASVLTPAVSDFSKRTLYNAYDIMPFLVKGRNCIGVWAGRGWFNSASGPRIRLLCRVQTGNAMIEASTDATWRCAPSPYTTLGEWRFGRFGGERYDARLDNPDWSCASLDDSQWASAQVAPAPFAQWLNMMPIHASECEKAQGAPAPVAAAQSCPPNRIGKRIPAVAYEKLADGKFRVDFGTDVTGWVRVRFPKLATGQTVTLTCADSLGGAEVTPNGVYRQIDEFISSGVPGEFCSKFSYHGFRTVTIEGLSTPPELSDTEALLVESDMEPGGSFECSNPLLNRIHELHVWTIRCLDLGGYIVDCPTRERLGYGAEGQVMIESSICNFWTPAFFSKWLEDWREKTIPLFVHGDGVEYHDRDSLMVFSYGSLLSVDGALCSCLLHAAIPKSCTLEGTWSPVHARAHQSWV